MNATIYGGIEESKPSFSTESWVAGGGSVGIVALGDASSIGGALECRPISQPTRIQKDHLTKRPDWRLSLFE